MDNQLILKIAYYWRQSREAERQVQNKRRVRFANAEQDDSKDISNVPERTFHPFPRLPIELRFQIWEMHLPEARVLEFAPLEPKRDFSLLCYSLNPPLVSHFEMKPLGVLPYVSRDSRQLFLGKYRLCFGSMLEKPIYFNPKVDIVMFSNEYALELFSEAVNHLPSAETREDVAPVRKAAIRWTCLKDTHRGVPVPENIALDPKVKGSEYRWKLRILSERLDTLQQFAFCYLDRRIGDASRANMIRFVESMEAEMSERFTIARKNRNPSIAQSILGELEQKHVDQGTQTTLEKVLMSSGL
ncbi:hypothetical protein L207DRAFT_533805 [Hyaloscypha variabilis F]|uniref:2EXR domain-containing protein n=1 Tax=Hyaloscypha variabilis (strain UAMH 11265 / GT02V1 / F) TaxID=1149755 RepID=A0A2J6RB15_HYAVF|nr:hypothetical protein L207DRAFT_533805 [Hyaloscypha variabilis F]